MPIIVNLDVMMAKRKISSGELSEQIEIPPANLSILKNRLPQARPLRKLWGIVLIYLPRSVSFRHGF